MLYEGDLSSIFDFECKNSERKYGVLKKSRDTFIFVSVKNASMMSSSFELCSPAKKSKRLLKKVMKFLIKNGLIGLPFKEYLSCDISKGLKSLLENTEGFSDFSMTTPIPGYFQKYVLQLMDEEGRIIGYAKVPISELSKTSIENEFSTLNYLSTLGLNNTIIPEVIMYDRESNILIQTCEHGLRECSLELNSHIVDSLVEICLKTRVDTRFEDSKVRLHIQSLMNSGEESIKKIGQRLYNLLLGYEDGKIPYSFAHRDFVLCNIKLKGSRTYIYDWEHAGFDLAYYDIFDFLYLTAWEVRGLDCGDILHEILNNKHMDEYEEKTGIYDRAFMFLLYLGEKIYYCNINRTGSVSYPSNEKKLIFAINMFNYACSNIENKNCANWSEHCVKE